MDMMAGCVRVGLSGVCGLEFGQGWLCLGGPCSSWNACRATLVSDNAIPTRLYLFEKDALGGIPCKRSRSEPDGCQSLTKTMSLELERTSAVRMGIRKAHWAESSSRCFSAESRRSSWRAGTSPHDVTDISCKRPFGARHQLQNRYMHPNDCLLCIRRTLQKTRSLRPPA